MVILYHLSVSPISQFSIFNSQFLQRLNRLFHSGRGSHREIHLSLVTVAFEQAEDAHIVISHREGGETLQIPACPGQFLFAQGNRSRIDVGFRTVRESRAARSRTSLYSVEPAG